MIFEYLWYGMWFGFESNKHLSAFITAKHKMKGVVHIFCLHALSYIGETANMNYTNVKCMIKICLIKNNG